MPRSLKRRGFVKALVSLPAASALLAQQQQSPPLPGTPANPAPGVPQNSTQAVAPRGMAELPKLEVAGTDVAAAPVLHFFTPPQFAALARLSDLLQPAIHGSPGALEAKAPEFLDFLLSESPVDRQQAYRSGLDSLNAQARKRYNKAFAEVDETEAAALLAPLGEAWTYETPKDPVARFLRIAKADVRTATTNSREYNASKASAGGGRRFGANGQYWYPLD